MGWVKHGCSQWGSCGDHASDREHGDTGKNNRASIALPLMSRFTDGRVFHDGRINAHRINSSPCLGWRMHAIAFSRYSLRPSSRHFLNVRLRISPRRREYASPRDARKPWIPACAGMTDQQAGHAATGGICCRNASLSAKRGMRSCTAARRHEFYQSVNRDKGHFA